MSSIKPFPKTTKKKTDPTTELRRKERHCRGQRGNRERTIQVVKVNAEKKKEHLPKYVSTQDFTATGEDERAVARGREKQSPRSLIARKEEGTLNWCHNPSESPPRVPTP